MENDNNFSGSDSPVTGPYSRWKTPGDDLYRIPYYDNTAPVALLLTGLCVGLPWLVGVIICVLRNKAARKALTVINVSLVFVALLQCLSSPVMAKLLLDGMCWVELEHCDVFVVVWYVSRHCGVLLHLLASLEFNVADTDCGICGRKLRHVYYSLPIVLTLVVVCLLFAERTVPCNIGLGVLACVFFTPTCSNVIWLCYRCLGPGARSPAVAKKVIALALAVVTFGLYAPSFGVEVRIDVSIHTNVQVYLNNMRLVTDAALFTLITRESNAAPPPAQPTDVLSGATTAAAVLGAGLLENKAGMVDPATGHNTAGVPAGPSRDGSVPTAGGGGPYVTGAADWRNVQQQGAAGDPPNCFVLQASKL